MEDKMNRRISVTAFVVLAISLLWISCRPKNGNLRARIPDGRYRLIAIRSGNGCLDIRGDNKRMQIWGCGDAASKLNQKFIFTVGSSDRYTITSPSLASRCLDVNEHN